MLRNSLTTGFADATFGYGPAGVGWRPMVGDWAWPAQGGHAAVVADGLDTVGLYDPATGSFYLRNSLTTGAADLSFAYGATAQGWVELCGRWPDNPPALRDQALPAAAPIAADQWITDLGRTLAASAANDQSAQLADAVFANYAS